MNSTGRWDEFVFGNFIEFLGETPGAAGGKLDAADHRPAEGRLFRFIQVADNISEKGHVPEPVFAAGLNATETVGPPTGSIDNWQVKLHADALGKIVADEDLRDPTVHVLAGVVRNFVAIDLDGGETG